MRPPPKLHASLFFYTYGIRMYSIMKKIPLVFTVLLALSTANAKERPVVKNINAAGGFGTKINVSWSVPLNTESKITRLFVYRSARPIASFYDLNGVQPVAELSPSDTDFADSVGDFKDYYYAVICEADGQKFDIILPSINSTVNAAHLKIPEKKQNAEKLPSAKEKTVSAEGLRPTPLPYLDILEGQGKSPVKLDGKTLETAMELSRSHRIDATEITEPYVFEEDLVSPDSGDDFLLFEILRNTFIQKKYAKAIAELERLIGTNRAKPVSNRAKFYLGESYYFAKDYRNATTTFLSVYDEFPSLSKRWIEASLDLYKVPDGE